MQIGEDQRLRSHYMRHLLQGSTPAGPPSTALVIPRVIVQFWHDGTDIPADVRNCMETWAPLLLLGFRRRLFDDNEARRFIARHLGRVSVAAFDRCVHPAMRSDYFRLCYLYKNGGFYVDADDEYRGGDCESLLSDPSLKLQPLCYDRLTDAMVDPAIFLSSTAYSPHWTFYVNNNPLVSPARHPVVRLALARSTRLLLDQELSRFDIQSTTGPGNLTASLVTHAIDADLHGKARDFEIWTNWETIAVSHWPLSYRKDDRNWRLWRAKVALHA